MAIDIDDDPAVVVAKAAQHRLEAIDIPFRPQDQRERSNRCLFFQGLELRCVLQCLFERRIVGRSDRDVIGLGVRSLRNPIPESQYCEQGKRYKLETTTNRALPTGVFVLRKRASEAEPARRRR